MLQIKEKQSSNTTASTKEQFYSMIFDCSGIQEKRELLKELSEVAKVRMEMGATQETKVNDVLIEMFSNDTHQNFNTFQGWKKQGFKVKKGEKGFFIWSNPLKANKTTENKKEEISKDEKDSTFKFFGLAHIFSNAQVEPLNN